MELDEHVNVIGHDRHFVDVPAIELTAFVEELVEALDELALQHFTSILRNEDNVVEKTVCCMCIVPERDRIHGPSIAVGAGKWAIPRAEARGVR